MAAKVKKNLINGIKFNKLLKNSQRIFGDII